MWFRSPHLKSNSGYFKVEAQHRWLARLYQYCQPIHLQQFVTTIHESYKGRQDLDGLEQNLFWVLKICSWMLRFVVLSK